MAYDIVRPADHQGWLAERLKGLGSSDAGTVMGVSPFSTPLRLWRQRMRLDPPVPESDAMRNGHYLEPAVAEYFAGATGAVIDPSSEGDWLAVDVDRPWLRVSPDRLFWPEGVERTPENRCILEIKSTSKIVDPDELPLYWICQVQYQMGVMGIDMAAIAWVTGAPRLSMDHAWISFNPGFYKTLTDALDRFWNENIVKAIPPDPIDGADVRLTWPTSADKKLVMATASDLEDCRRQKALAEEMADLQKRMDEVETRIKTRLRDGESLVWTDPETGDSTTIARFKSVNETVFDEERFRNERPGEYAKYLRQYFDKALFKDEDKALFKAYSTQKKGSRRFSVMLK